MEAGICPAQKVSSCFIVYLSLPCSLPSCHMYTQERMLSSSMLTTLLRVPVEARLTLLVRLVTFASSILYCDLSCHNFFDFLQDITPVGEDSERRVLLDAVLDQIWTSVSKVF